MEQKQKTLSFTKTEVDYLLVVNTLMVGNDLIDPNADIEDVGILVLDKYKELYDSWINNSDSPYFSAFAEEKLVKEKTLLGLRKSIINLLFCLFLDKKNGSLINYNDVDDFYAYIGYGLESELLLHALNIHSTSDLQAVLLSYCDLSNGDITQNDFKQDWITNYQNDSTLKTLTDHVIHLLWGLFHEQEDNAVDQLEHVEDFHYEIDDFRGYDLYNGDLFAQLGIQQTSDLQTILLDYQAKHV